MKVLKGNHYSKDELAVTGFKYLKETTITMYYRKENVLYIFEAKPNKQSQHKFITSIED